MARFIDKTIGQLLQDRTQVNGNDEAIVYPDEGIRWNYQTFAYKTKQLAKGLMALGIQKGEHIAVWANNVPEWILLQFASARMGAVLVTVNTNYRESELEYLLKQSDSTHLFLVDGFKDVSYTDIARNIKNSGVCPELQRLVYIGAQNVGDMTSFEQLYDIAEAVSDDELVSREQLLSPNEVINMQYTSGTTGFPKGVMLSHHNIVNNAYQVAMAMGLDHGDRLCIPVPFFHCFGCVMSIVASVAVGAVMVPVVSFEPETVLQTVESEKCTALQGVPTMFIAELNHPKFNDYDISTLKKGIMAGSPCPMEIMNKVIEQMGMTDVTIAYGQTESSPVITQTRTNDTVSRKVDTVGQVLPLVEAKVVEPETGKELPAGHQGELCTRGYHVMAGYYKNHVATKQVIDDQGWLHTGDLATVDVEGYYKITGRLKDMIIRGGENLYPREIEEFLYSHPAVKDVQVVGVPDRRFGEIVVAYVQLINENDCSEYELKAYCKGRIATYKIPAHFFFVSSYPMTASGKIQKYKLRKQAINALEQSENHL
ncbi:AMP-binding protein [Tuberibacillus sp. Marseille-P3662]|uniref:AMP-binding protein n=1 Tax=Tuberibacillus sp. Marseille-P3662 TaxID=1965358 RepID=UPI000A1CDA60|nr:AMP-binding protein [Tuberibacillus sp. Marseille-P3662]